MSNCCSPKDGEKDECCEPKDSKESCGCGVDHGKDEAKDAEKEKK
jgi:hypothetical protein